MTVDEKRVHTCAAQLVNKLFLRWRPLTQKVARPNAEDKESILVTYRPVKLEATETVGCEARG